MNRALLSPERYEVAVTETDESSASNSESRAFIRAASSLLEDDVGFQIGGKRFIKSHTLRTVDDEGSSPRA